MMGKSNVEESEADGKFTFQGLRPAAYTLRPMLTGYIVESGVLDSDGQQILYRPGDFASMKMVKGGVITGRVFGESGSPVVGVSVRAVRLRDLQGRHSAEVTADSLDAFQPMTTDDRGVYRIYGLQPGVYAVCAGGSLSPDPTGPFDGDPPVYHPGGPLADAGEVVVRAGQESAGIDISYREISGHSISGNLGGRIPAGAVLSGAAIMLSDAGTGGLQGMRVSLGLSDSGNRAFVFSGVPDGKYQLTAVGGLIGDEMTVAAPRTVVVQGSDLTGVDLILGPLAEVSGRIVLDTPPQTESKQECDAKPVPSVEHSVISIRKAGAQIQHVNLGPLFSRSDDGIPDEKGEFKVRFISSGLHFIQTKLHGDDLYVRSITLPQLADGRPSGNPAEGLEVKAGEKLSPVTITLARGAAALAGRVVTEASNPKPAGTIPLTIPMNKTPEQSPAPQSSNSSTGGNPHRIAAATDALPDRLQVIIIPAEPEAATDILRYAASSVQPDGTFAFKNLAPGRYYLLTRTIPDDQWSSPELLPDWYNLEQRKQLHRDAKKAGVTIDLNRCATVKDYSLSYSATPPATGSPLRH
jgi:hypothetical protein